MKLNIIGTGCTWTNDLCSSYILDDHILIDVPEGNFKAINKTTDIKKNVDCIIITHIHSDHMCDLHIVYDLLARCDRDKITTIYGPKHLKKVLIKLLKTLNMKNKTVLKSRKFKFIEVYNGAKFTFENYNFSFFELIHQELKNYAVVVTKNNEKTRLGFSGDTSMCNNLHNFIKASTDVLIDCSNVSKNNKHLCVEEFLELQKMYPAINFTPVHMADHSRKMLIDNKIKVPTDGDIKNFN